jgi:P-type E1-E2 ATPase
LFNCLTIGDGFNDIGMFEESFRSVAIQSNTYVESMADFSICKFQDLTNLYQLSQNILDVNYFMTNITFYRCSIVTFSLLTYYFLTRQVLFDSFVI